MNWQRSTLGLVAWVILCYAAGAIGSVFTSGAIPGWYRDIAKPEWTPPSWVFGPVWTALYLMMAVAAWLLWRQGGFPSQRKPLILFLVQLTLNAAWTPLFFGLHSPGLAFAEIILLWMAIAATLAAFRRTHLVAAWLLTPYLAWVSFAAVLNFTLWRLNP